MCDASMRIEDFGKIWLLIFNEFLQLGHLSDLLECENLILLVSIYGQSCAVVSTANLLAPINHTEFRNMLKMLEEFKACLAPS